MCCQYFVDKATIDDIRQILKDIDRKLYGKSYGVIRPSDASVVITGRGDHLQAEEMRWGFQSHQKNQLLINARAETVQQKVSFSDSILRRRCMIPAKQFYEWDSEKNKVTFSWKESPTLYMAGFYNQFDGEDRFIILTTAANDSMKKVHDRMPLILPEKCMEEWIYEDDRVNQYLKMESPMLISSREYEQLSLFSCII